MTCEKWLGIHTGGPHYLDHLGILCEGLDIPLWVTDQATFSAAKKFYPFLNVEYKEIGELSLGLIAHHADVVFESGHTFASELIPFWELMHGKKMRVVYCPHGNSDKKPPLLRKDVCLVYGNYMQKQLCQAGEQYLLEKIVMTSNYRASYYAKHSSWYDDQLKGLIEPYLDPHKKTVFYAPTWESDRWFTTAMRVIEEVGSHFNLLIRYHPFLEELYPVEIEQILCKGGIDLSQFPCIYPILNCMDYYLGDRSSIGYDCLSMNKPLFFLEEAEGEIYQCGITLPSSQHYGTMIASSKDVFTFPRKQLAYEVFGNIKSFEEIKEEIKEALSTDRASWITV